MRTALPARPGIAKLMTQHRQKLIFARSLREVLLGTFLLGNIPRDFDTPTITPRLSTTGETLAKYLPKVHLCQRRTVS